MPILLFFIIVISLGIPLSESFSDNYLWTADPFRDQYAHPALDVGGGIYHALILFGVIGMLVGLFNPRYVYLGSRPTRVKSFIFYFSLILTAAVVRFETDKLYVFIGEREIKKGILFSEGIAEKMKVSAAIAHAKKYGLIVHQTSFSHYRKIKPESGEALLPTLEFSFPLFKNYFSVVAVISENMQNENSTIRRIYVFNEYSEFEKVYKADLSLIAKLQN